MGFRLLRSPFLLVLLIAIVAVLVGSGGSPGSRGFAFERHAAIHAPTVSHELARESTAPDVALAVFVADPREMRIESRRVDTYVLSSHLYSHVAHRDTKPANAPEVALQPYRTVTRQLRSGFSASNEEAKSEPSGRAPHELRT